MTPARENPFANTIDIVVAPNAAFDRIRQVPAWGWAFLVAAVLAVAGTFLAAPAVGHAMDTSLPAALAKDERMAKLPPEEQQKRIQSVMSFNKSVAKLSWVFVPPLILIVGLIQALIMLIPNAVTRGDGNFKKFYALSITVSIVGSGIGSLVLGAIVLLRGAGSFETTAAVQAALPSLALLAPGATGALAGALGAMNVFVLWATALLALGMVRVGRIPRGAAWATAIVMLLFTAGFAAFGASQS